MLNRSHRLWEIVGILVLIIYWMLQAKLQQIKARDQGRAAAHPKRKITFVFIPLSSIGEEQVETLKDLEDDPNAAFFFDNSKAEPRHKYMCI